MRMRNAKTWMTGIVVAACIAGIGTARAQIQPQQPQQPQSQAVDERTRILEELSEMQERARNIQERLNGISMTASQENPELLKMQNTLLDIHEKKLDEYGYPSEEELQDLQTIQQRLQGAGASDMDEAERRQLAQTFNSEVAKLQQIREQAQNDPEFRQVQEELEEARLEAMREVDPNVADLQRELEELQAKSEKLREELQAYLQTPQQ